MRQGEREGASLLVVREWPQRVPDVEPSVRSLIRGEGPAVREREREMREGVADQGGKSQ